jgi:hypothetical protein
MGLIEMELEIKNDKFWILENKSDQNNFQRYVYDEEKTAMSRLKKLMKSVDVQQLFLSTVDVSGIEWKIAGVPWSTIAMYIIREEIADQ